MSKNKTPYYYYMRLKSEKMKSVKLEKNRKRIEAKLPQNYFSNKNERIEDENNISRWNGITIVNK